MIGLDPDNRADYGMFSQELWLSHEQRAALIVAVSTVLDIDQRDVPNEYSHSEDHLRELITKRYGSEADPVEKFRNALIQKIGELSTQR